MGHGDPLSEVRYPHDPLLQYFASSGKMKLTPQMNDYTNVPQVACMKCRPTYTPMGRNQIFAPNKGLTIHGC